MSDKVGLLVIMPYASVIFSIHVMKISTKSFQEFPFEKRTVSYKILHLILETSQFDGPLVSSLVQTL